MHRQVQLIQQQVPNQSYVQYGQPPIIMQGNLATIQPNSNPQIKLITGNSMITQGQPRKYFALFWFFFQKKLKKIN